MTRIQPPSCDCPKCATHRAMRAEVGQKRRTVCEAWHALTGAVRRSGGTGAPARHPEVSEDAHTWQDTVAYIRNRREGR